MIIWTGWLGSWPKQYCADKITVSVSNAFKASRYMAKRRLDRSITNAVTCRGLSSRCWRVAVSYSWTVPHCRRIPPPRILCVDRPLAWRPEEQTFEPSLAYFSRCVATRVNGSRVSQSTHRVLLQIHSSGRGGDMSRQAYLLAQAACWLIILAANGVQHVIGRQPN